METDEGVLDGGGKLIDIEEPVTDTDGVLLMELEEAEKAIEGWLLMELKELVGVGLLRDVAEPVWQGEVEEWFTETDESDFFTKETELIIEANDSDFFTFEELLETEKFSDFNVGADFEGDWYSELSWDFDE